MMLTSKYIGDRRLSTAAPRTYLVKHVSGQALSWKLILILQTLKPR
jgi:hypothetical protein